MPSSAVAEHLPAEVEAQPPVEAPEPATPPARGPGRPPRARGINAGHVTESDQVEQQTFWQYINALSEPDWEVHLMYLYRWQPFYDMTKGGIEPKYVTLYTGPQSVEEIKKAHGSGRYNLKLNRKEINTRSDKTIKQIVFDILDPAFPPNLPPGDWQKDPRNKQWAWGTAPAGDHGAAPQRSLGTDIRDIKDLVQSIYPDIGKAKTDSVTAEMVKILPDLIRERNQAGQAADPLAMISNLVTLMKAMQPPAPPPPAPPDTSMQNFLLDEIKQLRIDGQKQNERMFDLMKEKNAPPPTHDPLDSLDKILGVVGKVTDARETLGLGGGGSRMNGWQEAFSNVGSEIVKAVGPALPMLFAPKPVRPALPRPLPALPGAQPQPGTQQVQAAPPQQAGAGQGIDPQPQTIEEEEATDTMDRARFIAENIQRAGLTGPLLTYYGDGESGLDFARWLVDGHTAIAMNAIKGEGKEALLRAIMVYMPELYAQLKPNWDGFLVFVDEFLSWTPDQQRPAELPEEDEEETEPITTTAAAPPAIPPGTPPARPPARPRATPRPATKPKTTKPGAGRK